MVNGENKYHSRPSGTLTTTPYFLLMTGVRCLYKYMFPRIFRFKSSLMSPVEAAWESSDMGTIPAAHLPSPAPTACWE